jgi:protein-tyrosine phosphatase
MHSSYPDTNAIPDSTELHLAATFLNDLRAAGKTVFVHCRLGLNRSALLVGLMLIGDGYRANDAIKLMRRLRSPYLLENKTFRALPSLRRHGKPCKGGCRTGAVARR